MNKILHFFLTLICLIAFTNISAQNRNIIGLLNKYYYPGCGDNDPVFSVAAKLNAGYDYGTDWYYGGNTGWITPYYTSGTNGCGDILMFNVTNVSATQATYKWKSSDEDYCCAWYCDHNSNSCVSGEREDAFNFSNNPEGAKSNSCHNQNLAFADSTIFSAGTDNKLTKRNSLPLFNLAWIENYFWDGRVKELEDVFLFPITDHNEMNLDTTTLLNRLRSNKEYSTYFINAFGSSTINYPLFKMALAQYLRTLISYDTPIDSTYKIALNYMKEGHSQEEAIQYIFGFSKKTTQILSFCERCHSTITYGNNMLSNNGLDKIYEDIGRAEITHIDEDIGLFKVPSFRNLMFTAPYMHDGRFNTIEEVIEHYNSGIENCKNLDPILKDEKGNPIRLNLSENEKKEIISFIKLLSDNRFINNNKF